MTVRDSMSLLVLAGAFASGGTVTVCAVESALSQGAEAAALSHHPQTRTPDDSPRTTDHGPLTADSYHHQTWTPDDGLPGNAVDCLLQTHDGWLWIGARSGLARFDGIKFTVFDGRTPGFTDDAILALAEDLAGNLWIATKKGLYRKQGGDFTKFTTANGLLHDHVAGLHLARDGSLWVATHGGLNRFKDGVFTGWPLTETVHDPLRLPEVRHQILTVTDDSAGNTWVGTLGGLEQFDLASGRFLPVWHDPPSVAGSQRSPAQIVFVDRDGNLWCGTDDVLVRREGDTWHEFRFEADGGDIRLRRIVQTADGTIWVVRAGKLFRVQGDTLVREDERLGLADSYVTDVRFTREGIVWVSTRFRGLQCLRPATLTVFTTRDGLCHNGVVSVSPSRDGGLWVGTVRGLMRLRDGIFAFPQADVPARDLVCRVVFEESNGDLWLGTAPGLAGDICCLEKGTTGYRRLRAPNTAQEHSALFEDGHRRLWVGGRAGFACLLPDDVDKVQGREDYSPGETLHRVNRWLFEPTHVVMRATPSSVEFATNLWHDLAKRVRDWMPLSAAPAEYLADAPIRLDQHLSSYDVRVLLEDRHGDLWFGTWGGGLNRLRDRQIEVFTTRDGLAGNRIQALHQDAEGVLWIGTTEGLSRMRGGVGRASGLPVPGVSDANRPAPTPVLQRSPEPSGQRPDPPQFFSFTTAHGLPDNQVNQILEDDAGHLWIGCDEGIYRVAKRELADVTAGRAARVECLLLDEQDGLLGGQTYSDSQPSACKTPDGRLWFATPHGLAMLDPAHVSRHDAQPKVFLERLRVGDAWIELMDDQPTKSEIRNPKSEITGGPSAIRHPPSAIACRLPAGSGRSLEFEFTALEYFAPQKLRFRYKLEGFDADWVEAGARRTAYYTNLKPRAYRFQAVAGDHHGAWNETGAAFAFYLAPHYYETRWFQAACLFAGLGAVLGIFYRRTKMQRLEHLNSLAQERARITRDLHDDLAARVTYVSRLIEQARHEADRKSRLDELFGRMDEKLQEIGRTVGQAVWSANPKQDTLESLVTYASQYAEDFLEPVNVRVRFDLPNPFPAVPVPAVKRHSLFLVLKEALHNIVKHAGATEVWLRVSVGQNAFVIMIQDNGRGFNAEPASSLSQGLSNMRQRVGAVSGRFELTSTPGSGTKISMVIPISTTDQPR